MNRSVRIFNKKIGPNEPVYIIAEAGVTNYGDVEIAKRQANAAIAARADAIKYQFTKTELIVSRFAAKKHEKELGYDWYRRMKYKELSNEDISHLKEYVSLRGGGAIDWFASPHDEVALEYLAYELECPVIKIGSGESHNIDFLKKVAKTGKTVIVSFGLQTDKEAIKAVKTLQDGGADGVIAMHCTTLYPTPYELVDLHRMKHLEKILSIPVGFSDHSVGDHVLLAAVALGAPIIEKHLTFDKNDPRSLDNPGALTPAEWNDFVRKVRELEKSSAVIPEKRRQEMLVSGRNWAGQSIVAATALEKGMTLSRDMLLLKRPFKGGIGPEYISKIVGKKLKRALEEDEQVQLEDVA
ncbi:MAG: N-acetylneuraminate synthase family protein [Candidatus Vogelbacteria bacterium]|nr:N-acetylneuraminate synthase family protein [Candidatus Vogelbacteria bacterium]